MLDYGIFYEFIPFNGYNEDSSKIIPLSEVKLNTNYAMVITTNAGLWRYKIGDHQSNCYYCCIIHCFHLVLKIYL